MQPGSSFYKRIILQLSRSKQMRSNPYLFLEYLLSNQLKVCKNRYKVVGGSEEGG